MSQEVMTWNRYIENVAQTFIEIASNGKHVTWAEESQFALQALQKNEKLASCQPRTVQNAVINVAAVGLTLNPALGYAYLVPEAVKQSNGQYLQECMLRVSYKGLIKIATDSGSILLAKAEIVKEKDEFTYNGAFALPEHKMKPFEDRGKTVGVYCAAKTHQGDWIVDIMDMAEVNKISGAAKTDSVWKGWEDEMIKKAMIKRASKQWPKTDREGRLEKAVAVMNEYEGSDQLLTSPQLGDFNVEQKKYFDQLITDSDALGMFCFQHSLSDESIFTNLYHSFEKGQKGKYQAIVKDLSSRGFILFEDCRNAIEESAQAGDQMAARQIFEELNHDGQKIMNERLSNEAIEILKQ